MGESEWYSLILEWEESELTQQQFCSKRSLNYNDFKHWRTKGISEGVFSSSSRWRHNFSSATPSFTRLDEELSKPKESTGKYMEVCLPYGITLKLPI